MKCSDCGFDLNELAHYTKCRFCGAKVCDSNCYDRHLREFHGTNVPELWGWPTQPADLFQNGGRQHDAA